MNPPSVETLAAPAAAGSVALPEARDRAEPGITLNVEALAWGGVLAVAAALRFADLSALPLEPAEGPRARAALAMAGGTATPEWGGD